MTNERIQLRKGDRVLFSQLRAMGDTLLTTPAVRAFKREYPDVEVDFLTEALPAQVLKNNPHIRKIHIAKGKGSGLGDYFKLINTLRKSKYSCYFDFLSIPRSAIIGFLAGAKHRVGYDLRGRSWAYTLPVERRREILYNPLTKFDLLKTFDLSEKNLIPEVFPDEEDARWASEFLNSLRAMDFSMLVAFAPWSKREWRRLKAEGWLEIVEKLSREGNICWALFAAPDEHPMLAYLEERFPQNVIWAGPPSLLKVAALMKRCDVYFGADNGLKHIAVATGIPTITVYTTYEGVAPEAWNPPDSKDDVYFVVDSSLENLSETLEGITGAFLRFRRQ